MTGEGWLAIALGLAAVPLYVLVLRVLLRSDAFPGKELVARYGLVAAGGALRGEHAGFTIELRHAARLGARISSEWTTVAISGGLPEDLEFSARRHGASAEGTTAPIGDPRFDRAIAWMGMGSASRLRALGPGDRELIRRAVRRGWRARSGELVVELVGRHPRERRLRAALEIGLDLAQVLRGQGATSDPRGGDGRAGSSVRM